MKKSILLIAIGLIAGIANGQEARHSVQLKTPSSAPLQNRSVIFTANEHSNGNSNGTYVAPAQNSHSSSVAARTTSTPSRWYDYSGQYFVGILINYEVYNHQNLNYYSEDMWNDSSAIYGYTGTTSGTGYFDNGEVTFNSLTSIAQGLDPTYDVWNDTGAFDGEMAVTSANAYTIDSLLIPGWYTRSTITTPAKLGVVDTLIVALVNSSQMTPDAISSGAVLPYYMTTTINFLDLGHDEANNRAGTISGTTVSAIPYPSSAVYKFLLTSADSNDNCYKNPIFPRATHPADLPVNFAVPAGDAVAMSVTFKSGDTSYHPRGGNPGDTVRYSNGTTITGTKYSYWQSQVWYVASTSTSTTPLWNWYDPANWRATSYFANQGHGWGGSAPAYTENWNIITGTPTSPGPAGDQTPHLGFHASCPSCSTIGSAALGVKTVTLANSVKAYPNPATDQLNVTCSYSTPVSVTLTNMVGQVVATQNTTNGKAVFNTADLPSGVYIYSLQANGERATGRVAISH